MICPECGDVMLEIGLALHICSGCNNSRTSEPAAEPEHREQPVRECA